MTGFLSIEGVNVKTPKKFQVSIEDIDSESGRNANGDMIRDRLAVKQKLEISWGPLSDKEISTILTSVKPPFFTVTYPDPETGGQSTKSFYVGARTAPMYSWNDTLPKWEGLAMNFIER
ncbi:TPA: DUF6711 family protein [Enterococcus faecalis]